MAFPRLIPILLMEDRRLIKTIQFDHPSYIGDVQNAIKIFNEKEVDEVIVLDIAKSKEFKEPDYEYIEQLATECFMPITYGGGISSPQIAKRVMECGVEKVSLNTGFLAGGDLPSDISFLLGSSSTVLSIDVRNVGADYVISGTNASLEYALENASSCGFGEVLIQSIAKDGQMLGPDLNLISKASQLTNLPIVYAGGISSLEHCTSAWKRGASGVGAGAWFVYKGPHRAVMITYPKYDKVKKAFEFE
jgi:cyclase